MKMIIIIDCTNNEPHVLLNKRVITKTDAVYQKDQTRLNGLTGRVESMNEYFELIVKLDNGLVLPFSQTELKRI